ncbi:HPF/RaiA family ribosome-associated protein [Glaciecola sp. KUL10]|uniref:HPF/RaiA family ribosome-associated protein n=1 Tax=Glaciecola sp. (strain KUL10) TaxID=2161813 RepID=UPI000D7862A2|nr:HPF/RaiA family ribosome-associated protein [Glaciecola sp. KUL10]GBL03279.1 methyl-accepting chemotaxis sensory transducer [Glaciecola sp. KUL10]
MNVYITKAIQALSPQKRVEIENKLKLALSRFGQMFDSVNLALSTTKDSFNSQRINCSIEIALQTGEVLKADISASSEEEALESAVQRIKRNLERHRKLMFNCNTYQNHGVIEK